MALRASMLLVTGVYAAEHQIKLVNSGKDGIMVFEPDFIQAAKGDNVKFVNTDASHNSSPFFMPIGMRP